MVKIDNEPSFALSKHAFDSGIVIVQVEVFDELCEVFDIPLASLNVSSPSVVPLLPFTHLLLVLWPELESHDVVSE